MEYETVKYEVKSKEPRETKIVRDRKLEISLKALDNLEFEMPAVCH